jgi:dolichol-phosphate mannosyltransferase
MYDLVIILPTYNELENLKKLLPIIMSTFRKMQIKGGVLVVDDNSPDGSGDYVEQLIPRLTNREFFIKLLRRPGKLGLGTAYVQAYDKVIKEIPVKFVLGMDADFSHDPKYLPEMYKALTHNDMVIGSRYVPGGGTRNWSWIRRMVSRMGGLYSKMLLWWTINDPTTAFTGFRVDALKRLDYHKITAVNYGFNIEMKYQAWKKKFKFQEVPIIFADRVAGKSKFSSKIFSEGIINTFLIRFKYRNYK